MGRTMAGTKAKKRKAPAVGAPWRSKKGLFTLVPLAEAERLTGHSSEELRGLHGVQVVTRIYADGSREQSLRVPSELVLEVSS